MKRIGIEECHEHLLKIVCEIHTISQKYDIPYYIIGGTLLGAVRHKGFIPWDDDMDIGVPIEYYEELMQLLGKELPSPYRVCRYWDVEGCGTVFAKIDDTSTCINDPRIPLPIEKQIGINVDVFPLNHCSFDNPKLKRLRLLQNWKRRIYTESTSGKKHKHIIKKVLQFISPLSHKDFQDKIYNIVTSINEGGMLANLFSPYGLKEFMPIDYFGEPIYYQFEDTKLLGPCKPHEYLTQLYGNYMQLPPEEKRMVHADEIYLR